MNARHQDVPMSQARPHLCLLCHSIGPYHAARYAALGRREPRVVVLELSARQSSNPWNNAATQAGVRVETLFQEPLERVPRAKQAEAVRTALDRLRPAVVVSVGYADPGMRAATLWARRHQAISIMVTDTWRGDKRRFLPLELAKGAWCRWAYDALFLPGVRHADYFASLGFSRERIWRGVSVVDNAHFQRGAEEARAHESVTRTRYHLPDRYFLCCARQAPEKNLERLLRAFWRYRQAGGNWSLVLVGSGPLEGKLRHMAEQQVPGAVIFAGWQQYDALPAFYGLAEALILPSLSEPWGLVVNEAMAAGLPVLVSRRCGCLPELCWRGINGDDFDPSDEAGMAHCMERIAADCERRKCMGEMSQRIIASFTPDTWATALLDCVHRLEEACT